MSARATPPLALLTPPLLASCSLFSLLVGACATASSLTAPLPTVPTVRDENDLEDNQRPRDISSEAYRAVLEAELKMQDGDLAGGLALLREAALQDPRSSYLRVRLADAYLEGGDLEQARDAAEEALRLQPRSRPALLALAHTQRLAGDGEGAERTLARLLAIAPADRDGSLLLAEITVERGDVDGAERIIERLMDREPGAVDGYLALARVFAERGDLERAVKHANLALARENDDPDALGLKLTVLFARGAFLEALPVARQLASAAGDTLAVRRDLLAAHALAQQLDTADQLARTWLEDDGSEAMRLLVSSAWERVGELERATRALDPTTGSARTPRLAAEAARLLMMRKLPADAVAAACPMASAPAAAELSSYLLDLCARSLVKEGRAAEAVAKLAPLRAKPDPALLETLVLLARAGAMPAADAKAAADAALAISPANGDTIAAVARVYEALSDVAHARALLDDALRARPRDADLLFALARHLERNGNPASAVEIVERLLDRGVASVDALNFVAFTLANEQTRGEHSRRLAWRALVRDPLNGYVVDTLGWTERAAGALEAARATLARADRLSPGEGEILFHRAVVEHELGALAAARTLAMSARAALDATDPVLVQVDALLAKLGESP